jgi:hypothetical protein
VRLWECAGGVTKTIFTLGLSVYNESALKGIVTDRCSLVHRATPIDALKLSYID